MSVYSNTEITKAIKDGTIICVPFNPKHVSEASLDFTLGHYFYKQEYCGCIYSLRDTNEWRQKNDREVIKIGEQFYEDKIKSN